MKIKIVSAVIVALALSVVTAYAEETMGNMNMMGEKFNMQMKKAKDISMKMETEKSPDKRQQYMRSHMENMKDMMSMMDGMMMNDSNKEMMKNMNDCQGMQGKGMMNKGQNQPGMMAGGMMQMMGGMMEQNSMMEKRMEMMHEMMGQMLKHMEMK